MTVGYQLSDFHPDGSSFGQNATVDKISFYGVTPIVQPTAAAQAAYVVTATSALATTTVSQVATSGKFGFSNGTVAALYLTRVQQMQVDVEGLGALLTAIRTALVNLGAIKGS